MRSDGRAAFDHVDMVLVSRLGAAAPLDGRLQLVRLRGRDGHQSSTAPVVCARTRRGIPDRNTWAQRAIDTR